MNTANFVAIPAGLFPDQEILCCADQRLTYGRLWQEIERIAAGLHGLGVQPGDCVAALDTTSHHYVELYYAVALLGAVFVPLNYRAKPIELAHMLGTANVETLVVGERYADQVDGLMARLPRLRRVLGMAAGARTAIEDLANTPAGTFIAPDVDDDATVILMYTSGTTSMPKAVLLTHNDFTSYVCNSVELADGSERGVSLGCMPLYHIAGMTNVMTTMFTGRRLVLMRQFAADAWLQIVDEARVTHAFLVPTMVKQVIDCPRFASADLRSLQSLAYGGAPMPLPILRRALERFPTTTGFVNAFGQTETTSTLTVLGPEDHRRAAGEGQEQLWHRLQSIGRPLPDVELRIVDDDGNDLPGGATGELWVRTPRLMKGYASDTGVVTPLRDGWLPTRDMGWIDADGYVFLAGRKDDMIIRGGENIAPAEVEAVLQAHPGVEEAAVLGVADEEWGQQVAAAVVPRAGVTLATHELTLFCKQRLASFKVPTVILVAHALPHSALGKVLRGELRVLLGDAAGRR